MGARSSCSGPAEDEAFVKPLEDPSWQLIDVSVAFIAGEVHLRQTVVDSFAAGCERPRPELSFGDEHRRLDRLYGERMCLGLSSGCV